MKYIKFLVLLISVTHFFSCKAMSIATITVEVITANTIERIPAYIVSDKQSYTNGGLVVNYPVGLFTTTPIIRLAVEAAPHASSITYTAEISSNSTASATIMVYKITAGTVTEAATAEVTVNFVAAGA